MAATCLCALCVARTYNYNYKREAVVRILGLLLRWAVGQVTIRTELYRCTTDASCLRMGVRICPSPFACPPCWLPTVAQRGDARAPSPSLCLHLRSTATSTSIPHLTSPHLSLLAPSIDRRDGLSSHHYCSLASFPLTPSWPPQPFFAEQSLFCFPVRRLGSQPSWYHRSFISALCSAASYPRRSLKTSLLRLRWELDGPVIDNLRLPSRELRGETRESRSKASRPGAPPCRSDLVVLLVASLFVSIDPDARHIFLSSYARTIDAYPSTRTGLFVSRDPHCRRFAGRAPTRGAGQDCQSPGNSSLS